MKTQKGNKLLPIIEKEDFLRNVLIDFARKEDVAPKLLEANFVVEEFEKEYFVFLGEVECNYSCSIGYNRTENYVEYEKKQKLIKQPDGKSKWEWVTEPVNKTRTVTDWQAHSGTNKGKTFIAIKPDGEWDEECWEIMRIISNNAEEFDEEIELDSNLLSKGIKALGSDFRIETKYKLPGDKEKDFTSTENVEVLEVRKYRVPFYSIKYTFKGKEHSFEHCACCESFNLTLGEEEQEKLKYIPLDTSAVAKADKEVKKATKIMKICWISVIPAVILSAILPSLIPGLAFLGSIINIAFFAVAIIFTIKKIKKFNEVKSKLDIKEQKRRKNIVNEKHKQVYEVLKKALEKHGLSSATFDEVYFETTEE